MHAIDSNAGGGPNQAINGSGLGITCTQAAVGNFEGTDRNSCSVRGWAYDPDSPNASINVHVYRGGAAGAGGTFVASCPANSARADVNAANSSTGNHGFNCNLPASMRTLGNQSLWIHAIDVVGTQNNVIGNSPIAIDCYPPPTINTLDISRTNVWPGEEAFVSWTSDWADTCTASGDGTWSGSKGTSATAEAVSFPTPGVKTISLRCDGIGGTVTRSATITVDTPTVDIDRAFDLVRNGASTEATWTVIPNTSSEPNSSCQILGVVGSPYDINSSAATSVSTGPLTNSRLILLSCTIFGILYTDEERIEVVPTVFEI